MSDRPDPPGAPPPDPPDGEVLSAYLTGELDAPAAARLEERLAADPDLARRLDDTARVLVTLRGVDAVDLPPGAGDRLRQRLAAAGAAPGAPPEPHAGDPQASEPRPAEVTPLSSRRRVPWPAITGVAAGLAAVALVGAGILQGFGGGGLDMAEDQAAEAPQADDGGGEAQDLEAAPEQYAAEEEADTDRSSGALEGEQDAPPQPAFPQPGRAGFPLVLDEDVRLDDADAVVARYTDLPEAAALLGEPVEDAAERAGAYRSELAAARPFASGARPDDCLDGLPASAARAAVPVRAESAVFDGEPAIVHVLVVASEGSPALDRVEVAVTDPSTCEVRLSRDVTGR